MTDKLWSVHITILGTVHQPIGQNQKSKKKKYKLGNQKNQGTHKQKHLSTSTCEKINRKSYMVLLIFKLSDPMDNKENLEKKIKKLLKGSQEDNMSHSNPDFQYYFKKYYHKD